MDLRQYVAWCTEHRIVVVRAVRHRALRSPPRVTGSERATISRRLCTIACFYRYAEQEELIANVTRGACPPPATRLRIPRHRAGPQRGRRHAGRRRPRGARDHALISLLALNGLRVSEATGADIEALGLERGHRTLTILRKGGKTVIIPLAPRTARPSISRSANAARARSSSASTATTRPPRRRADRAAHRPQSRYRQTGRTTHPAPRVHHRRPRRRRPAA